MEQYTLLDWMSFFYIYCFLGWCFESTYATIKEKKPVNRGFLRGPMIPIYGFAALFILFITGPWQGQWAMVYLLGITGATVLEYVTGYFMEKIFKVRYWDYSDHRYNVKGYISLSSSLAWGFLSLLLTDVLQPQTVFCLDQIPKDWRIGMAGTITVLFLTDVTISTRAALNFAKALEAIRIAKKELLEIRDKLGNARDEFLASTQSKLDFVKEEIGEKVAGAGEKLAQAGVRPVESLTKVKTEIEDMIKNLPAGVKNRIPDYSGLLERFTGVSKSWSENMPKPGRIIQLATKNLLHSNPFVNKTYSKEIQDMEDFNQQKPPRKSPKPQQPIIQEK